MGDPSTMMGPMKRQLIGYVPQIGLGALVNFFFDGFVLGKVGRGTQGESPTPARAFISEWGCVPV